MPRYPDVSPSLAAVEGAVFSRLRPRREARPAETYPLHVGDTWLEPPPGCRMEDLAAAAHPGLHRYAPPQGIPALLDAVARRVTTRTGVATEPADVLITAGATGGLAAAVGAIVDPGDEVLLAAPYWPLIPGIVRCAHGVPAAAPLIGEADSADAAVECLSRGLTARTVALYLGTPNNPTGRLLPPDWVAAIARWAAAHDLWVLADEVYEDCVFRGEHAYARALAPERTFSAHSFSKGWAMAGNRCGYVVGPASHMAELRKVGTHTFYAAPTAAQLAVCKLLENPERSGAWLRAAHRTYLEMGRYAAERLGVDPPAGSTFLFLDVAPYLDERGLQGFLLDCGERGVFVAPGPSFGPYPTHVRVCFTAAPPDVTRRGIDVLAGLLRRSAPG